MDLISVFHMDVEWFGIYGPVENGLDMDYNFNPSGPLVIGHCRKYVRGLFLRKMTDSLTFQLSV